MREPETTDLSFINLLQEFRAVGEFAKFAGHAWTGRLGRPGSQKPINLADPWFSGGRCDPVSICELATRARPPGIFFRYFGQY